MIKLEKNDDQLDLIDIKLEESIHSEEEKQIIELSNYEIQNVTDFIAPGTSSEVYVDGCARNLSAVESTEPTFVKPKSNSKQSNNPRPMNVSKLSKFSILCISYRTG